MLQAALQHEKKKKLHSAVKKKAGNSIFSLIWSKKKLIPVHGNFPLRAEDADVDRATNHQWLSSLSLKAKNEGFILVAQDHAHTLRERTN